jgi:hypothetical protein
LDADVEEQRRFFLRHRRPELAKREIELNLLARPVLECKSLTVLIDMLPLGFIAEKRLNSAQFIP